MRKNANLKDIKNSLAKKLILSFLLICAISGILLSYLYFNHAKQFIWRLSSNITTSCALTGAKILYDAPINDFLKGEQKDVYNSYYNELKDVAESFNIKFLYVYVPDIENDKLIPVMGIDGETGGNIKNYNLGEPLKNIHLNPKVVNMYLNKQPRLSLEMNNEFGHVFTGYSTVIDTDGNAVAVIGADIEYHYLIVRLAKDCSLIFLFIFFVLFVLFLCAILFIQKTFIKPILHLSTELTRYLNHDVHEVAPIVLSTGDELNLIANLCSGMALEKKHIESELDIAKKIQMSSLPMVFPPFPNSKEFDIFADISTAKKVGGDFYDFFFVDTNSIVFLIADVCGKGVPAALFMMKVKSLLENNLQTGMQLEEAITRVNAQVCESNKENYFVTAFIASINLDTGDISFVNAGHNYPLIKHANEEFEYYEPKGNIVLGIFPDFKYEKTEKKLNAGDTIFLYTDGVTEAMNENEELYGEERLKTVLNASKETKIEDIVSAVKQDVAKFSENAEQSDDITTLIFKYNGAVNKEA